ncbi:MAG: diguanylate cyclase [Pyrinomonadaceae bacterium]
MKLVDFSDYDRRTKVYWLALMCLGLPIMAWAFYGCLAFSFSQLALLGIFAIIVGIAGLFPIRVPNALVGITANDALVFLSLIYGGIPAAVCLGALDAFLCSFRLNKQLNESLMWATIRTCSIFAAGLCFYGILILSGESVAFLLGTQPVQVQSLMTALSITALLYFCLNSLLIASFLALKNQQNSFGSFFGDFIGISGSIIAGAFAAGIIYEAVLKSNWFLGFLTLPIIVLPYFAYRIYFQRLEEKSHESIESQRLYMSAIEALSNAIDAREQLTPGHVRRVQIYAVETAKIMNLPHDEIKSLELAALLHGVGKLAVPDYILNKPSSLTQPEKERVKMHPLVGAEIVKSVNFPFPVANAVKYYNESWDGYGYPEGLRGEETPIAARILGIADAYDTMREERPFRAIASREEARRMLLAGAGTRFDPKLVDIFLRHLAHFEKKIAAAGLPLEGRGEIEIGNPFGVMPHYLEQIRRTNREVFALYELARVSSSSLDLRELLLFLGKKVQELVPCETCVIYLYDAAEGKARAAHATGKNAAFLREREVKLGEGVVGFALKNGKAVSSVNPALDFLGDYALIAQEYLTMAVLPLKIGDRLIGALTVYSEKILGYDEEHLRLLETTSHVAAEAIARTIQHAQSETLALTDALTGLPNARSLQLQFEKEVSRSQRTDRPFQFIMFDLDDFKLVNDIFGHKIGDQMLCEIAEVLRAQLRDYDFISRYAGDEFVALVPEINNERMQELCYRIEQAVVNFRLQVDDERSARVGISIGAAEYPAHGETLDQIMVAADQNMYSAKAIHKQQSGSLRLPKEAEILLQSIN